MFLDGQLFCWLIAKWFISQRLSSPTSLRVKISLISISKSRCKDAKENEYQLKSKGKFPDRESERKELTRRLLMQLIKAMVHTFFADSDRSLAQAK